MNHLCQIRKHYLQGWFALDCICGIPMVVIVTIIDQATGWGYEDYKELKIGAQAFQLLRLSRLVTLLRYVSMRVSVVCSNR